MDKKELLMLQFTNQKNKNKNMKKLILSLAVVLLSATLFAAPVSIETAKIAAQNSLKQYAPASRTDFTVNDQWETKYNGLTVYYTYTFQAGGFAIISADDRALPVLGMSTSETFDKTNVPENCASFLNDFAKEIYYIVNENLVNEVTVNEWNAVLSGSIEKSTAVVGPLCATTWDQTGAYATYVPSGTPTGCVATAMAQVMKKWNYPTTGTGSHSYYSTYAAATLTANFGATTYNWAAMPNASGNTSVARLMSDCGISVDMDYETAGSGAQTGLCPPALVNYFNYQPTCQVKSRSSFPTDALWLTMVKEEINEGRPLMLTGDNAGAAGTGHQWVCDGYQSAASGLCHMNWGWSGSSNGNYQLYSLTPPLENFNSDRQAVIRITPLNNLMPIANFSASTTIPAIGAGVDFTDLSLNTPTSWLWTFDGGTPATSTSQNPTGVTFATNGYHVISLKVTNATGSDIITKERYIKVGGAPTVWTKQNSSFTAASRGIDQVAIVDANTVWAKGYDGITPANYIREFTRTNNAGATWTPGTITFSGSASYGVANLAPVNYMTCYAAMFPTSGQGGQIVKTTDGGVTWNVLTTTQFNTSWLDFVHFFDANNGIAVGDPTTTTGTDFWIYTTNNAGVTWTQVPFGSIPNSLTGETGIVNYFSSVGNTLWFSTTKGRVFKTTDMGMTWSQASTGLTYYMNVYFKDANYGIVVSDSTPYTMRKTINGGTTWTALTPTGYEVKHPNLAFVPGTTSTWVDVASYPSNGSSMSMDDGATYVNVDSGSVPFTSVAFLDINTGWAGSFNMSATDDGIYKWNNPATVGLGNNNPANNGGNISVYPIPSKDIVNIAMGKIEDENVTINVYNVIGAKVLSRQEKTVSNDIIQIDMSDKEAGLYFVNVVNGGKTTTKKITIVK